jgi:hypothetical protein
MKRFLSIWLAAFIWPLAGVVDGGAAGATPPFESIYGIVRSNLSGASDAHLNDAAVRGFLRELKGQASLVMPAAEPRKPAAPLVAGATVFDGGFAYLRVTRIQAGLAEKLAAALGELRASNTLNGLVLDLRFANGRDYHAAAQAAGLFMAEEKVVFHLGTTAVRAPRSDEGWKPPLMALINRKTAGAAEALAAVLRQERIGLVLGGASAGEAYVFKEFPLEGGQRLRVATQRVKLAGGEWIGSDGVKPDIAIPVEAAEEQAWLENPYLPPKAAPAAGTPASVASTNAPRRRITEAELVRQQREGNPDEDLPATRPREEPAKPLVRDPVLARALDLLKGLAIVRPARAP